MRIKEQKIIPANKKIKYTFLPNDFQGNFLQLYVDLNSKHNVESNQRNLMSERKKKNTNARANVVEIRIFTLARPLSLVLLPRRSCNAAIIIRSLLAHSQKRNSIEMDDF